MSNRLAATPSFISKLVGPCIRRMTFNRITVLLTVLTIVTFSQLSLSRQNNLLLRDAPELPTIDQKDAFFRSQAGQDRWIFENLMASNVEDVRNRGGFFIEFGARDGAEHSNTYFFEHFLGWNGLLIEASPSELGNILQNRPGSAIVHGAVCDRGIITLFDTGLPGMSGDKESYDSERFSELKDGAKEYEVKCYPLDYLVKYFKIEEVDLMTVDTEGSELSALKTFPFNRVKPKLIAVELLVGNKERDSDRMALTSFMESKGYKICKHG